MSDRAERLAEHGRFYAQQKWAVAWTEGIEGDAAKRVRTSGWDKTEPLTNPEHAAGFFATRGLTRNPVIVARPSGLILVECDSEEDVANFQAEYMAPRTITVSSSPGRKHFYYRSPFPDPEFVGFRFEAGNVTASRNMYLVAPPAMHPSGAEYRFVKYTFSGAEAMSTPEVLPESAYKQLVALAGESERKTEQHILSDDEAKVPQGNRRTHIFKLACSMRRRGVPEGVALDAAYATNDARCDPPLMKAQVIEQVHGAYTRYDPNIDTEPHQPHHEEAKATTQIKFRPLNTVKAEPVEFLVGEPRVPIGGITLVQGLPGVGKSTWVTDLAAKVTKAGGGVGFSTEEHAPHLKARIAASGGDVEKVFVSDEKILLPGALKDLEQQMHELGIKLMVFDTLFGHLGPGIDANNDQSVKRALEPLAEMLWRRSASGICISHLNKSQADQMSRGAGSLGGIMGTIASGLMLEGEPGSKTPWLHHFKARHSGHQPVQELTLEEVHVPVDGQMIQTSRIKPPFDYVGFARASGVIA